MPLYPAFAQEAWNLQQTNQTQEKQWARCTILIDSGTSFTVVGKRWANSWRPRLLPSSQKIEGEFRLGAGATCTSLGMAIVELQIPKEFASTGKPLDLSIYADVVDSQVPLLLSKWTRTSLQSKMEFTSNKMKVISDIAATLIHTGGGHLQLPDGKKPTQEAAEMVKKKHIYPWNTDPGSETISYGALKKIHLHLGHCSEFTLKTRRMPQK